MSTCVLLYAQVDLSVTVGGNNSRLRGIGFDSLMPFHVQREMIGATEGAGAQLTAERFDAGVLAKMTRQLIGAGESPDAALPDADVRFFA